jgi:Na+-translocating ferredoxin:NAD+ oxidoreductase RnfG subunit
MKKEALVLALYAASSIAIVAHATVEIHKTFSQSRRDKKLMLRKENLKTV